MILEKMDSAMQLTSNPYVAVYMITYNQDKYIRLAIESIMQQKTNFPVKLFIGDDASSDQTQNICAELMLKYPDKIEPCFQKINIGATNNAILTFKKCISSGAKYIALCEGDDYWTNPLKLQKQVDFLETHKEYNGVFHKVSLLNNSTNEFSECVLNINTPDSIEVGDLLKKNIIRTCSIVLRTESVTPLFTNDQFVNIYKKATPGDWLIFIFAIRNKKMKYFSENMAVYRIHDGGMWSEAKDIELKYAREIFNGYVLLKKILPYKYFKSVFNRYAYYLGYFAEKNFQEKKYLSSIFYKLKLYFELFKMKFIKAVKI